MAGEGPARSRLRADPSTAVYGMPAPAYRPGESPGSVPGLRRRKVLVVVGVGRREPFRLARWIEHTGRPGLASLVARHPAFLSRCGLPRLHSLALALSKGLWHAPILRDGRGARLLGIDVGHGPGLFPRFGPADVQVDVEQDERPQDHGQDGRDDRVDAPQVREVVVRACHHATDDEVRQDDEGSHGLSRTRPAIPPYPRTEQTNLPIRRLPTRPAPAARPVARRDAGTSRAWLRRPQRPRPGPARWHPGWPRRPAPVRGPSETPSSPAPGARPHPLRGNGCGRRSGC